MNNATPPSNIEKDKQAKSTGPIDPIDPIDPMGSSLGTLRGWGPKGRIWLLELEPVPGIAAPTQASLEWGTVLRTYFVTSTASLSVGFLSADL